MQKGIRSAGKKNRQEGKSDDAKARMVIGVGLLFLVFCAVWGEFSRQTREMESRNTAAKEITGWIFGEAGGVIGPELEGSDERLSDGQRMFLGQLEKEIAGESLHQAAKRLLEKKEELQAVWSAGGQRVLYVQDGEISASLTGMGLAVRGDGTCFYGNFNQGSPEGVCTAIRYLDGQERVSAYEYSMGIWKAGRMDGLGMTGKSYFSLREKEQVLEEQVSGVFQADRLDGQLTYQQIDRRGRTHWWEMAAEKGKTRLDKRWVLQENLAEYRLFSKQDRNALFVLPQNLAEKIWWENRVPWVEEP